MSKKKKVKIRLEEVKKKKRKPLSPPFAQQVALYRFRLSPTVHPMGCAFNCASVVVNCYG